jgi:Cu/Ag efflux protein CusF
MKSRMNQVLFASALVVALAFPALAQQASAAGTATAVSTSADFAEAEVRKVDKAAGKITLKHGEIKSLDMPPMTMVFGVTDKALLDNVKAGDKVRFRAANQDGRMTVTELQASR